MFDKNKGLTWKKEDICRVKLSQIRLICPMHPVDPRPSIPVDTSQVEMYHLATGCFEHKVIFWDDRDTGNLWKTVNCSYYEGKLTLTELNPKSLAKQMECSWVSLPLWRPPEVCGLMTRRERPMTTCNWPYQWFPKRSQVPIGCI
jgi:hypothetical protein